MDAELQAARQELRDASKKLEDAQVEAKKINAHLMQTEVAKAQRQKSVAELEATLAAMRKA